MLSGSLEVFLWFSQVGHLAVMQELIMQSFSSVEPVSVLEGLMMEHKYYEIIRGNCKLLVRDTFLCLVDSFCCILEMLSFLYPQVMM